MLQKEVFTIHNEVHTRLNKLGFNSREIHDIFSGYAKNDDGHKIDHAMYVYNNACEYAKHFNMDVNDDELFIASILHDMFSWKDRKRHNVLSCDYALELGVKGLDLESIGHACLMHRSSGTGRFENDLARLVYMGDMGLMINLDVSPKEKAKEYVANMIKRMKAYFSTTNSDDPTGEALAHMKIKYGSGGYTYDSMPTELRTLEVYVHVRALVDAIEDLGEFTKNIK